MARPDVFFTGSRLDRTNEVLSDNPISFFLQSETRERAIQQTDNGVRSDFPKLAGLIRNNELIWNQDLPRVSEIIFQGNDVLNNTLGQMGLFEQVRSLKVSRLQNGTFAHHLIWAVGSIRPPVRYFVTYISRFPVAHALGAITELDYRNLQEINLRLERSHNGKRLLNVIKPYDIGTFIFQGKTYPFYTSRFNEIGAEVHMILDTFVELSRGESLGLPVYHDPFPGDERSLRENQHIVKVFDAAKNMVMEAAAKQGMAVAMQVLLKSEAAELSNRQQTTVARACAVLYLIANQQFPRQHAINAGDWMAEIHQGIPSNFTLVTTRGSLMRMSEGEWINWMINLKEYNKETAGKVRPFPALREFDYKRILAETRKLLR